MKLQWGRHLGAPIDEETAMPAAKSQSRKKSRVSKSKKTSGPAISSSSALAVALVTGAILGFSAPGWDQWYIAWIGLVPFLLLVVSSSGLKEAFARGAIFALGYNMVYLNWYIGLHPLYWLGYNMAESYALAGAAWLILSAHQALITGVLAMLIRFLPLTGGFLPRAVDERLCLPAPLVVPILWVLVENKIGNAPDFLGVPWTMIEYSQYQQLPVIQAASWIGGIGIGALIVMFNTVIAGWISTMTARLSFKPLASQTKTAALSQALAAALCVVGVVAWGYSRLNAQEYPTQPLSVIQGSINIDMERTKHRYSLPELLERYGGLLSKAPAGICIWTESALPTYLKEEKGLLGDLVTACRAGKHDMIVGSIDHDVDGRAYNSAYGIDCDGRVATTIYHKRYLVPFGEYMPGFAKYLPEWVQRLTNTPAGVGFHAGKKPAVLDLSGHAIAPLICFETLSPELVASSVRNGGTLLVNLSDLAWFHESMVGDQMVAFSVMRAVESGRYFVFAANTGPSTIIDDRGRILKRSPLGKPFVLTGKVRFNTDRTPFTQWFN
jgi:apolipoprotein N-acyltransferase